MRILAFDTATTTGFACGIGNEPGIKNVGNPRGTYVSGIFCARPHRSQNMNGMRFSNFDDMVRERLDLYMPDVVFYEMVVGGMVAGGTTSLIQKGLEAILLKNCWKRSRELHVVAVAAASIKKWATGSGKLTHESKRLVVENAVKIFGAEDLVPVNPTKAKPWSYDDNQCDALWLLDLGINVVERFGVPTQENVTDLINRTMKFRPNTQ